MQWFQQDTIWYRISQIQGSFFEKEKEELSYGRYIPR